MEKAHRYPLAVYAVLLAGSVALLAGESAPAFWQWLFMLLCYAFLHFSTIFFCRRCIGGTGF